MGIVNAQSGTRVDEVAEGIFRISTPLPPEVVPGGFSFNQYLVVDDEPLLFHTGPHRIFPFVREAVASVLPLERLRWVGLSHVEGDECGALNDFLAAAPQATPLCSRVAALTSIEDMAQRPPRAMAEGETLGLGKHRVTWLDTPHLPHGWECGYMYEAHTRTLLCGDLFTQPGGADNAPLTGSDILGPSEAFRLQMDYFSHSTRARAQLERLAALSPRTLACMHGSAWEGEGGALLRALADSLCGPAPRA